MPPLRDQERLISCRPAALSQSQVICVQAAPNPEYWQAPKNYAHWMLAHLIPLLHELNMRGINAEAFQSSRLHIAHGENPALAAFLPKYAELHGGSCELARSHHAVTQYWIRRVKDPRKLMPWKPYKCNVTVSVYVPQYAACHRTAFSHPARWLAAAKLLRDLIRRSCGRSSLPNYLATTIVSPVKSVSVLLREKADAGQRGSFEGMHLACDA